MKIRILIWIAILIILSLACNISGSTQAQPTVQPASPGSESQPTDQKEPAPTAEPQIIVITATPEPTDIPSRPVTIREGLASLNSYVMVVHSNSSGPNPEDMSEVTIETQHSSEQDAQFTHLQFRSSSTEDPEISESDTTIYSIGLTQCTITDDEFEYQEMSSSEKEMSDLMTEMLDLTPIVTDPQMVGTETINGVETNHFTFIISGLGSTSGAEVLANNGEYWLALDGNYIVKYSLLLETRDSEGKVSHFVINIELTQINQPVTITMPEGCTP